MGTYIIHFDDKPWQDLDDEQYYRCKEIPWFSTTRATISRLTPYTEDSAYAHGYTEAESKYREIRDELEKQAYQRGYETAKHECEDCQKIRYDAEQELVKKAYDTAYADAEEIYGSGKRVMYQKGLKDAWEAARTLWNTPNRKEIFGHTTFNTVLTTLTAQKTIEKIRQYEQEREIQVGDEVVGTYTGGKETEPFVIIKKIPETDPPYYPYYFGIYSKSGEFCQGGLKLKKTGRHFPELVEVLQKMRVTK